jgi:hypothetical protein
MREHSRTTTDERVRREGYDYGWWRRGEVTAARRPDGEGERCRRDDEQKRTIVMSDADTGAQSTDGAQEGRIWPWDEKEMISTST